MIARFCRISGRVQGVGFRYWAEREAARLGVVGWVRNVAGGVETVVQGEKAAVEAMIAMLDEGPRAALVESVEVSEIPIEPGRAGFEIRF